MRNYKILQKFMKVDKSYDIPQYFFGQIPCFHSISFKCDVLFAFCNFVLWWTKFFCLLLYHFASRQHLQIFCHRQTKGDISNIADTYCAFMVLTCKAAYLKVENSAQTTFRFSPFRHRAPRMKPFCQILDAFLW